MRFATAQEAAARQALDAALRRIPGHPEVLRLYGLLHHARAASRGSDQHVLQQWIAQWPDYALAHSDLGNARTGRRPCDGRVRQLAARLRAGAGRRHAVVQPRPQPATAWAIPTARSTRCRGRTALAPDFLPALILLGDALVHAGRFDEAAARYRAALALHPACGDAWRGLANIKTQPLSTPIASSSPPPAPTRHRATDRIAMGFALGKLSTRTRALYAEPPSTALNAANAQLRDMAPWNAGAFHAHADAMLAAAATLPERLRSHPGRKK